MIPNEGSEVGRRKITGSTNHLFKKKPSTCEYITSGLGYDNIITSRYPKLADKT